MKTLNVKPVMNYARLVAKIVPLSALHVGLNSNPRISSMNFMRLVFHHADWELGTTAQPMSVHIAIQYVFYARDIMQINV